MVGGVDSIELRSKLEIMNSVQNKKQNRINRVSSCLKKMCKAKSSVLMEVYLAISTFAFMNLLH